MKGFDIDRLNIDAFLYSVRGDRCLYCSTLETFKDAMLSYYSLLLVISSRLFKRELSLYPPIAWAPPTLMSAVT